MSHRARTPGPRTIGLRLSVALGAVAVLVGAGLQPAAAVESPPAATVAEASTAPLVSETEAAARVAADVVKAANLANFRPGNIIGDAVFFNRDAMTEAQIQSFLNARVPTCQAGYTCLKTYRDTSRTIAADPMCAAYAGNANEPAAKIIYKVARACGINPQVILVTLQKEQSLVTSTAPSASRYRAAMGQGCPDTAACDTRYYGFFNQVYGAAHQFKRYANPPGTSQYFTWYAPGKTWNLLYHPNRACGTSPVYIENQATANLYYYTPYRPNAAALKAGYGTGDSCSSYGNRNFYSYFIDWFGSTQYSEFQAKPTPAVTGEAVAGQVLTATAGSWSPAPGSLTFQWLRGGVAIAGATAAKYPVTNADAGAALSVKVTAKRNNYITAATQSTTLTARGFSVDRISGANRFDTAVAVSKRLRPTGAETVYLATGGEFADALSASSAAARADGVLLLTAPDALPASVAAELVRLAPSRVVLVGAEGAITPAVADAVVSALATASPSVVIERRAGASRYETSRTIADSFGTAPRVYLATGRDFPDALGASAVAGAAGAPVLLIDGDAATLDAPTLALLAKLKTTAAVIVGGEGVISKGIAAQLTGKGIAVTRYGGANRYLTNALLNSASFPAANPAVFAATAMDYPDALGGSVLAAEAGAPMFVTGATCASGTMTDFLKDRGGSAVTLVGGSGALSDAVAQLRRC